MALHKILGVCDLITGLFLLGAHFGFLGWRLPLMGAVYLIVKAIIFKGELLSILDMVAGIYIILVAIGLNTILAYVFFAYLFYKFITSIIF